MTRPVLVTALATLALAPLAEAARPLLFRSAPTLSIEDDGVIPVGGQQFFDIEIRRAFTRLSAFQRSMLTDPVVVFRLWEVDRNDRVDADFIGIYEAPVRVERLTSFRGPSSVALYGIVRSGGTPVGAISAEPGAWPHAITASFATDPDPDVVQKIYVEAVSLTNAGSLAAPVATTVGRTRTRNESYYTSEGSTLISASAQAQLSDANPNRYIVRTSIVTDQKLSAPAQLQLPLETDPPLVQIVGASSATIPDVTLDTSGANPTLIVETEGCDRTLSLDLELESLAPRGAVDEVTVAFDTTNAIVTDMAGDPVPLQDNLAFTTSLLVPADEPASVDASSLSFTPVVGSTDFIAQVEALPGAVSMTNDGLALGARATIILYEAPPAGLIDPEILGAGTADIAADGSFTVDLIGEGDGFPPTAVALISIEGADGRGDADVVLPLADVCATDLDADGQTGAADIAALIAAWGACP